MTSAPNVTHFTAATRLLLIGGVAYRYRINIVWISCTWDAWANTEHRHDSLRKWCGRCVPFFDSISMSFIHRVRTHSSVVVSIKRNATNFDFNPVDRNDDDECLTIAKIDMYIYPSAHLRNTHVREDKIINTASTVICFVCIYWVNWIQFCNYFMKDPESEKSPVFHFN